MGLVMRREVAWGHRPDWQWGARERSQQGCWNTLQTTAVGAQLWEKERRLQLTALPEKRVGRGGALTGAGTGPPWSMVTEARAAPRRVQGSLPFGKAGGRSSLWEDSGERAGAGRREPVFLEGRNLVYQGNLTRGALNIRVNLGPLAE